jgi:hypothetical protein
MNVQKNISYSAKLSAVSSRGLLNSACVIENVASDGKWIRDNKEFGRKSYIVWDIMPCSSLKINRCFGGTCRLHFQDSKISRTRNQLEAIIKHRSACYLLNAAGSDMFL